MYIARKETEQTKWIAFNFLVFFFFFCDDIPILKLYKILWNTWNFFKSVNNQVFFCSHTINSIRWRLPFVTHCPPHFFSSCLKLFSNSKRHSSLYITPGHLLLAISVCFNKTYKLSFVLLEYLTVHIHISYIYIYI